MTFLQETFILGSTLCAFGRTPLTAHTPLLHCSVPSHPYTAAYPPVALRCVFCFAQVQGVRPNANFIWFGPPGGTPQCAFCFFFILCLSTFCIYLGKALLAGNGGFTVVIVFRSLESCPLRLPKLTEHRPETGVPGAVLAKDRYID